MSLNKLRDAIHKTAVEKGFWSDTPEFKQRTALEIHALIHSEVSEATEEARTNNPPVYTKPLCSEKPEGEAVELIDAVIRILDYFGARGWDADEIMKKKMAYNTTRQHRHGGKLA